MVKGRLRLRGEDRNVLESLNRKTDLMRSDITVETGSCSTSCVTGSDPRGVHRPTVQAREERVSGCKEYCDIRSELARGKADMREAVQVDWIDDIPSCPVYHPSKEEFADPLQYLQNIAPEASKYGMCKIVSPLVVSVPAGIVLTKEQTNFKFTTRVQPTRLAHWDVDDKITFPESGRNYSLTDYEKMANRAFARKFSTAANLPTRFVEGEFWKELISGKSSNVEYACDVDGSAFSASDTDPLGQSKWNLKGFSRLLMSTLRHLETPIAGVTDPMLYIGMLFSMFAWHVEDHYLFSINYHHCGAPKTWYGVPGRAASEFENVVQDHVYNLDMLKSAGKGAAYDMLIGKTTMFAPKLLSEHDVPVFRAVQRPGEFVITFPRAYHAGFSHGFNCGEAVNFATADWFPYGAAACWRYEFLSRDPLLSHEELLCKEAMLIPQTLTSSQEDTGCSDDNHQRSVKVAFLEMMRFQHKVQWFLKQKGARVIKSVVANVLCGLCKHVCNVSYVMCKCNPEPMCLNHGRVIHSCVCGYERSLFVTVNLTELEARACKFEHDSGILSAVSKESEIFDPSTAEVRSIEENMLKCDAYNLYIPFCDSNAKENKNTGHPLTDASLPAMGAQVEAVACADSHGDEKSLHSEPPSEKSKNSGSEQSILLTGEERLNSCSNPILSEISCTVASSNGKQGEDEEESDTEAFRVKRRRALPTGSRRFEVDSLERKPKRLKVMLSQSEKKHDSLHGCKNGQKNEQDVHEGYQVMVHDVIRELDLKGSVDEVICSWQAKARNHGMKLKIKELVVKSKKFQGLSLKGCKCLAKLLPEGEKLKLEQLMRQALRNAGSCKVEDHGNSPVQQLSEKDQGNTFKQVEDHGNSPVQQPSEKDQGNTFKASSLTCSKLKSLSAVTAEEQPSVILSEKRKTMVISKVRTADHHSRVKLRMDVGSIKDRRKASDVFSAIDASDSSCEVMQKAHILSSVESSVQSHQVENLKGKKQKVSCRNTESGYFPKHEEEFVGLTQGALPAGVSVKYSDCKDKQRTQKVACLKVKGSSPPALISDSVYKVKRTRSSLGIEIGKEDIARIVAEKEPFGSQQDKQVSNQKYSGQYPDDGMSLPVEKEWSKKKGRDFSKVTADTNLKCCECPGKARTGTSSELGPDKGLIVQLNRKVEERLSKSLISHTEKEEVSIATGNILDQGESKKPNIETARCPKQEAAISFSYHCVEGSTMADESCFNQDASPGCTGLNAWKDKATATGEGLDKSDPPAENILEEGELRECGFEVELADRESKKNCHKDVVHSRDTAPPHDIESLFVKATELKKYEEYSPSFADVREINPDSAFTDTSLNINTASTISMDLNPSPLLNGGKLEMRASESILKEVDSSHSLTIVANSSSLESIKHLSHQGLQCQQKIVHFEQVGVPSKGMFPSSEILHQWQLKDLDTVQHQGSCFSNNSGAESVNISSLGSENMPSGSKGLQNAGLSFSQFYKGEVASKSQSFNSSTKSLNEVGGQTGAKLGLHSGQKTKTTPLGRAMPGKGWLAHDCERTGFFSDASSAAMGKDGKDVGHLMRDRTSSTVVMNGNQRGMYNSRHTSSNVQFKRNAFHYQRHQSSLVDNFRSFKHPQVSFNPTKEKMPYPSHLMRQQRPFSKGWGTDEVESKGFATVNNARVKRILDSAPVDSVINTLTESGSYHYNDACDLPAWRSSRSSRHWQYGPPQVQTSNARSCERRPLLHEAPPLQALGQYNFEEAYGRQ